MKKYLPYNVLLIMTVITVGLMAVYNLALRQSSFAVTVGYKIPKPPEQVVAAQAPVQPWLEDVPLPDEIVDERLQPENTLTSVQFPLELNSASYEQLLFIPQVGNVTAQRIIQYREHLGGYERLSQLLEIKGIGDKTYQHITAYLYLDLEEDREEENIETGQDEYNETDNSID